MPDIHPEGTFPAVVLNHGIDQKPDKNPFAWAKFRTDHGSITGFFYMTDRAAEYALEKMANMGFEGRIEEFNDDPPCCEGNKCEIVIAHETWEGKTRAKIQFINQEGGGGPEVDKSTAAAANASRFNGLLDKIRRDKGTKPATSKNADKRAKAMASAPYDDDEDLPF